MLPRSSPHDADGFPENHLLPRNGLDMVIEHHVRDGKDGSRYAVEVARAGPWDGDFGASGLAVPMVSAAGAGAITALQRRPSSMPAAQSERCGLTPIATPPKVGNRFVAGYQNPSPAVRPAAAFACRVAALRLNFPRVPRRNA